MIDQITHTVCYTLIRRSRFAQNKKCKKYLRAPFIRHIYVQNNIA